MKKIVILITVCLLFVVACGSDKVLDKEAINNKELLTQLISQDKKAVYNKLADPDTDFEEKKELLKQLQQIESVDVTLIFLLAMQGKFGEMLKYYANQIYFEQLEARNLFIFSRLLKNLVTNNLLLEEKGGDISFSPQYALLLHIVDAVNPLEKKKIEIAELLKLNVKFGRLVLLTLAFEGEQKEFFYHQLKKELFHKTNTEDVIVVQVIQQVLNEKYIFDFVVENLDNFVAILDGENVYALAKSIMQRDIRKFNEVRMKFIPKLQNKVYRTVLNEVLDYVTVDSINSPDLVKLLLKPLAAEWTPQDVKVIAHWVSNKTELTLLAICAGSEEPEVISTALGFLLLKYTYLTKDIAHIMSWIKKKRFDLNKTSLASACKLSLSKVWTPLELNEIIDNLEVLDDAKRMLVGLLDSNNPDLVLVLLQRYYLATSNEKLIEFLKHENPEMRVLAVKGLADSGDFVVKRALSKALMREKDEEVLKVYRELDDFK
ncbi:MAG: hypothetical protein LBE20_04570 [Deltaproteobacteria bacterium]|jgi:hypothetical protein|nr:hypothetical protein [Deltaproteobacteria bacterium]